MANSAAPLVLLGGAALILMGGKKKKSSSKKNGACPPVVYIEQGEVPEKVVMVDFGDGTKGEVSMPKTAYDEAIGGNRDIIDITTKVLAPFIPPSCVTSESIKVRAKGDAKSVEMSAVEAFYTVGMEMLGDLHSAGLFGDEASAQANELNKWWVRHMGEKPLPEVD